MAQFGDFTVDRNSTKYVLGSGGTIISYATDEPAFEFNADGSYKGLLVEPAATNLLTYSEDLSQWTAQAGTTVTTDQAVAPDGNTTADLVEGNGSSGILFSGLTVTDPNTRSIYLRSVTGTETVTLKDPNNTVSTTTCNLTTTWQRFEHTQSTSGAGGLWVSDIPASGIYMWGGQVENGPIATSYIPTTTASVTRVADDILLGSASSLIGQTEGTLYVEVYWQKTSGVDQYLLEASDGSVNSRLFIYRHNGDNALKMSGTISGSPVLDLGIDSSGFSGIQKIAFAYANGDQELYHNGSSAQTATASLAALGTLTDIDIGQAFNATVQANMWIRAVALFTRRLSDAEAEALTTL